MFASTAVITLFLLTLQNNEILFFKSSSIILSVLHNNKSGWIPTLNNCLTECWVGLVFNSPADSNQGIWVTCMIADEILSLSLCNCRIASRNGKDSISPTVPPISHKTKSSFFKSLKINFFISSVTWGITCIVAPR